MHRSLGAMRGRCSNHFLQPPSLHGSQNQYCCWVGFVGCVHLLQTRVLSFPHLPLHFPCTFFFDPSVLFPEAAFVLIVDLNVGILLVISSSLESNPAVGETFRALISRITMVLVIISSASFEKNSFGQLSSRSLPTVF